MRYGQGHVELPACPVLRSRVEYFNFFMNWSSEKIILKKIYDYASETRTENVIIREHKFGIFKLTFISLIIQGISVYLCMYKLEWV